MRFQCPMWRAFRLDRGSKSCNSKCKRSFSALCGGLFGWIPRSHFMPLSIKCVSVPYVAGFSAGSYSLRTPPRGALGFSALCGGLFGWIGGIARGFKTIGSVSVPYVAGFSAGSKRRKRPGRWFHSFQCPMWRAFRLDHYQLPETNRLYVKVSVPYVAGFSAGS